MGRRKGKAGWRRDGWNPLEHNALQRERPAIGRALRVPQGLLALGPVDYTAAWRLVTAAALEAGTLLACWRLRWDAAMRRGGQPGG